ncbi:hypothetical protein BD410DRAFT_581892 [Rickenella mellea]|uniref:Uncharacterized protein n=1 Tax=Rickenella mellea TaxID=50990 RepID=A0A4Y7PRJ8_9AGAM|nr:hypothetical protein BD410DRAFT_581892 [Rickenella mellea]
MRLYLIAAALSTIAVQHVAAYTGFTIWHSEVVNPFDGSVIDTYSAARFGCDTSCSALFNSGAQSVTNPFGSIPGNPADVQEMDLDNLCNGPPLHLIRNGAGANVYRRDTGQQVGWCNPASAHVGCFGLGATSFDAVWNCDSYICQC